MIKKKNDFQELRSRLSDNGGKILVIQTAFLGDVILSTPIFRVLRKSFPASKITALIQPQFSKLLRNLTHEIITFDKKNKEIKSTEWENVQKQVKLGNFDLAIIPHRSLRSGSLAFRANIKTRIGFNRGIVSRLYSERVEYKYSLYEGSRNLALLRPISDLYDNGLPEINTSAKDAQTIERIRNHWQLEKNDFAIFAPGSVWRTKRWESSYYAKLSEILERDYQIRSVFIGGNEDVELCREISKDTGINLAGKLSIMESAELIKHARFLISGDSAPVHIATAMKIRQVIIFGSTDPRFGFLPPGSTARSIGIDLPCRPCTDHGRNKCCIADKPLCLTKIKPENIIELIKDWV